MPGRMPSHSSAIAEYPVRTGLTEMNLAPRRRRPDSASLIGFESWSSATPNIRNSFVRSQSGSPNSQKLPPIVYIPAAAMLTEQNPPCAAKFGVPNWVAQNPVNDWLWSRPVKKASFFGSSARIFDSHDSAVAIASSHSISRNSPTPRSPTRNSGLVSLAGEYCCMMPEAPLPQITPRLTG